MSQNCDFVLNGQKTPDREWNWLADFHLLCHFLCVIQDEPRMRPHYRRPDQRERLHPGPEQLRVPQHPGGGASLLQPAPAFQRCWAHDPAAPSASHLGTPPHTSLGIQTKHTSGLAWTKKKFSKSSPRYTKRVPPLPPFFAICNYLMVHTALCLDIPYCLLFAADTKLLLSMWVRRKRSSDDYALWMIDFEPVCNMIPTRMRHFFDKSSSVIKSEAKPPYDVKPIRLWLSVSPWWKCWLTTPTCQYKESLFSPLPQNWWLVKSTHRAYHSTYQNMKRNSFFLTFIFGAYL